MRYACLLGVALLAGCSAKDQDSADSAQVSLTPTGQSHSPSSAPAMFVEDTVSSAEDAVERLTDESARLAAAVRLIRVSGVRPLCVPEPLPQRFADDLRVVALGETRWVLGLVDPRDDRRLRGPVLIDRTGGVRLPVEGLDEEVAVFVLSEAEPHFPHVIVLPDRVLLVADETYAGLVGKALHGCRFDVRATDGFPRVVLLGRATGDAPRAAPVVAEYRWDFYEAVFAGPQADEIPGSDGQYFELDVARSRALIPIGGRMPPVAPVIESRRPESQPADR